MGTAAEATEPPSGDRGTVLVVEDNAQVLDVMAVLVERLGYTVFSAKNASEALVTFTNIERLDVLLADVILPGGVHGTVLADAIRKVNPTTGVVFMTGYSDERLAITGVSQTWVPVLRKPFQMHELAQAIEEALEHGSEG